jgi:hypothetical protein
LIVAGLVIAIILALGIWLILKKLSAQKVHQEVKTTDQSQLDQTHFSNPLDKSDLVHLRDISPLKKNLTSRNLYGKKND